jgi:aryl-alcohol dehydrogenase-like predicted oxidoreductase
MQYRKLGKTGLMISAVCLGGHWKGIGPVLRRPFTGSGYDEQDFDNIRCPDFLENRGDVISRAIELGINYVDACSPPEILAYARLLAGRRDKFYFGYSWHTREPRYPEWRTAKALVAGLDAGLSEAGLDYIDLWRLSLPVDGIADPSERERIEEAAAGGLALARKQGKARFTGVSSHDRLWLAKMLGRFPEQIEVVLFPFTGGSAPAGQSSLLDAILTRGAGALAIKPFAGGALFAGGGDGDRLSRLAIRHILAHPGITAVVGGFASAAQMENAAAAAAGPRPLDAAERAELDRATTAMWPAVSWLRDWEYV